MDNYTVIENEGFVEVCIVSTDLTGIVDVEIAPVTKEVDNPAAGIYVWWKKIIIKMLKLMMLKIVTVYTVNTEAKSTKCLMVIIIIVL